jgi:hypothetical protein
MKWDITEPYSNPPQIIQVGISEMLGLFKCSVALRTLIEKSSLSADAKLPGQFALATNFCCFC